VESSSSGLGKVAECKSAQIEGCKSARLISANFDIFGFDNMISERTVTRDFLYEYNNSYSESDFGTLDIGRCFGTSLKIPSQGYIPQGDSNFKLYLEKSVQKSNLRIHKSALKCGRLFQKCWIRLDSDTVNPVSLLLPRHDRLIFV
jgi:hypothetical protein